MQLNVKGFADGKASSVDVSEAVFGRDFCEDLVHQAIVAYQAGGRAGTRAQKNRSDVSGGGAKPWKQKGTGRARAGSSRSPIWRSGGKTFAARPQDHSVKLNKKMYKNALSCVFSELIRMERLHVVDEINLSSHKTKELVGKLDEHGFDNALIVANQVDKTLYRAANNIPNVDVTDEMGINIVNLVKHDNVMITVAALKQVEEQLS